MRKMKPAVFFDRDGVLNVDVHFLYRKEEFQWVDGAIEAILLANAKEYYVFVVTNQSGVARGYYEEKDVLALHDWMQGELGKKGAHIDAFFYCPHHVDGIVPAYALKCQCRKPAIGMIMRARDRYEVDMKRSVLVGDKDSDMECAANAGLRGLRFTGGNLFQQLKTVLN